MARLLVIVGGLLAATGIGMLSLAAGLVVAGVELAAYGLLMVEDGR